MTKVLVLLTNWKRPANMSHATRAWRDQSLAPASVVVVDNSPREYITGITERFFSWEEPSWMTAADNNPNKPDDVWRLGENLGPLCRLWPALALAPKYEYVLFADDDFVPGRDGLLAAVQAAKYVNDKFGTIGQEGRTFSGTPLPGSDDEFRHTTYTYKYGDTPRLTDAPRVVDCTVRCHLVLASHLPRVLRLREKLPADLCNDHDDLLLCLSLQVDPGLPSYILPASTLDRQLIRESLPGTNGPEACWRRPDHLVQRSRFINLAYGAGWRSFVEGDR